MRKTRPSLRDLQKQVQEPRKKRTKIREKRKIPRSVQRTIPFLRVCENGIIEIKKGMYSKSISFQDINYQIAKREDQEDIFVKYGTFLNSFDPNINIQITINNTNINRTEFEQEILLKLREDGLDEYRKEYNSMLRKQIDEGRNDIRRDKYITLTIQAKDIKEAEASFRRIETDILSNLSKIGSHGTIMETEERLSVLREFYCPGEYNGMKIDMDKIKKQGLSAKDVIAPDSFTFKKDYMMIGKRYARAMFLKEIPSYLGDKFLSDMTDFAFNMMTTISIQSVAPEDALKIVNHQITDMKQDKIEAQKRALKSGYDPNMISDTLDDSLKEAQELLDDLLNKNQKMFLISLVIIHLADTLEDLNKDSGLLESAARKYLCQLGTLSYQQEDALNSVVPLGVNRLHLRRTLTTESTAVFMPFTSQELVQPGGMYYGLNGITLNLIMFNRKSLKNPNGFILGTPGSGKSFSAKREMVNILLNHEDDVMVIDPEREYSELAKNLGGEVIEISASSKNFINPLDMSRDYADDENPLILKSDFVLSLCDLIIATKGGLDPVQKAIIDRCVKNTYEPYFKSEYTKPPTLLDFYNIVNQQSEPEARNLAVSLELYTKGSLSVFANQSNVDINNRFVVFDIKDLGKQMKNLGMLIVLDAVWNRITQNRKRGKKTWLYFDEAHLLFKNEYSANYLYELYKRARKWGGILTGITQNIEDLLESDLARKMLSNSDFIQMLNQAPIDREELANLLSISETQLVFVTNAPAGQGLLFSGTSIIPFIDRFPTNTKLYQMMTTKPDEIVNR